MLSVIPFSFFFSEEGQEPPAPAHPTVYVLRNGHYEPQYLMPVMPRPDMLDFEGFVPARWGRAGAGARRTPAPEMQQAALRKSLLSIRRDSLQLCVTPAAPDAATPAVGSAAASAAPRPDDSLPPAVSLPNAALANVAAGAGSLQVSFTFDATRRGTVSIHVRVTEKERCLGSSCDDGMQHGNSSEAFMVNSSGDEKEDVSSNDAVGGKQLVEEFDAGSKPSRMEITLLPIEKSVAASEVHRSSFEPGVGQQFKSPPLSLESCSLDSLAFNPDRPSEIPMAIRLDAESEQQEAPTTLLVYVALQASSGPSGAPWPSQVFRQRLLQDGQCFILRDVFGTSSFGGFDSASKEGRSECVICLTEPRDTAVLPCRHLCFCSHCAGIVRLQCERCPICRQRVGNLMQLKRE